MTAHKKGQADITVTTEDGGFTATKHVIVSEFIYVSSINVTNPGVMIRGTRITLNYTLTPGNPTIDTVVWKSSDSSVVYIRENTTSSPKELPVIEALKVGAVTLTGTAKDGGGAVATITIAVVAP